MRLLVGVSVFLCGLIAAAAAEAKVQIDVDLSSQTMHVNASGASYDWPVSTARAGYSTPRGNYHAGRLEMMHYSRKYHMSPMPHSIFFAGGFAIHGTYETAYLGRPASHGCVRLAPGNAALLYGMVRDEGGADIRISGSAPASARFAKAQGSHHLAERAGRRSSREAYGDGGEAWRGGETEAMAYAPAGRTPVYSNARRIFNPVMRPDYWPQ